MAKKHRRKQNKARSQQKSAFLPPREEGNRAFRQGEFGRAIKAWGKLDGEQDEAVETALAEAHFRRGLAAHQAGTQAVADLRRAVELCLDEGRYWYHLGLALHRSDQVEEACAAYARAVDLGYQGKGLGFTRGLAEVERDPGGDLDRLSWLSAEEREGLDPVAALLRKAPQEVLDGGSVDGPGALWQGLGRLVAGEVEQAREALAFPGGQQLRAEAEQVRLFYLGLTAAKGDRQAALEAWTEASRAASRAHVPPQPRLSQGLAQMQHQRLYELQREERWEAVLKEVHAATAQPRTADPALLQVRLVALQHLAMKGAAAGEWKTALDRWEEMGAILRVQPSLGDRTPLFRNAAIGWEALEEWGKAGEAWAAVLGALPRRGGKKETAEIPVDEQRDWLRRRIVENFERAERPDRAIGYFKQMVKDAPDDLEVRLELAEALWDNDQIIAARNEARRILEQDGKHVGALMLLAGIHQERDEEAEAEEVLQQVLEIDPDHEEARREIVDSMMGRGVNTFNDGDHHEAWAIYTEALEYGPTNIHLLALLGDTELTLGDAAAARERFDQALASGQDQAYGEVFECWAKHGEEKEARRLLKQAEERGAASHIFYLRAGAFCLNSGIPPSPLEGLFGRVRKGRREGKWEKWGRQLIDKGLDLAPDRGEALDLVLRLVGMGHPEAALEYARQLVALAPDSPEALFSLGLLQGMTDAGAAKETLQNARRLARSQGNEELIREIDRIRRDMDNPLFGMLGPGLDLFGGDFDEEDFF
jgi:tetratricopeptide (TPR) repeat protein